MGADDLLANGFNVAVIENHVAGNPFQNTYSNARHSYYGGGGTPNMWFDGVINSLGGFPSGSMYANYLPKYNQRAAVLSNFTIALNGAGNGSDFIVLATIENVAPYAGTNLVLQFTITESHIPHNWGTLTEANHVNRMMVPGVAGTPLDFSGSSTQSVMLEFTMNASWVPENCEFVAFVQDNTTKEILQGTKVALPDLMPMYYNNAGSQALNMVPVVNCEGEVAPRITIVNEGADPLTYLDINYIVNDENLNTFNWTGSLGYGETTQVDLPATAFELMPDNNLMVYTSNPNGSMDEDNSNDTLTTTFISAMQVVPDIHLYLKLDDNPQENTWELRNSADDVLYSGGPYTNPQEFIHEVFPLSLDDCYTLHLFDAGGDGLVDGGFFNLRQGNYSLIYENNDFDGVEELVQFSINLVAVGENDVLGGLTVSPNPFTDITRISFSLEQNEQVELKVYNLIGEVIYTEGIKEFGAGQNAIIFDGKQMQAGIYFINMKIGEKVLTRKVTIY